jgi:hypothetical protein
MTNIPEKFSCVLGIRIQGKCLVNLGFNYGEEVIVMHQQHGSLNMQKGPP